MALGWRRISFEGAAVRRALIILAKAPQPKRVKTRLAAAIGPRPAADLQRAFLLDLLAATATLRGVTRFLGCWPSPSHPVFDEIAARQAVTLFPQVGRTLGDRMAHALRFVLGLGVREVVLLGSDSPTLPMGYIEEAFRWLGEVPLVIGPSYDGGYYLIGVAGPSAAGPVLPSVFDGIPWGTSRVFALTLKAADQAGVVYRLTPRWYDVDTAADLQRLAADLRFAGRPARAVETRRVLETLNVPGAASGGRR